MNILKNCFVVGEETLKQRENEDKFEKVDRPAIINRTLFDYASPITSWWKPSPKGKKRILLCGTYPIGTSNGYSKVVYYISKYLGTYEDIELTVYGFQNFANTSGASLRNNIPPSVKIHDAFATENPKRNGFGELEIADFIKKNPQDVIIIFNDNVITSALTQNIMNQCGNEKHNFKLISYMDQVYAYQKKAYIELLNKYFDGIIAFTPYWAGIARKLGIKESMPMYVFPHGFDEKLYFPIPMKLARMYFNYDQEAFLMLNLNRNQPRKDYSSCIIAWMEFVERHYQVNVKCIKGDFKVNKHTKRPVKFIVGTQMDGYWDLWDLVENECKFRDVPLDYAKATIVPVDMPQQLSDRDINILYNACDVGINLCEGAGYELTTFEHLGIGKPQIASFVGGIKEYLTEQNSTPVYPCMHKYGDNKTNGIVSKAELTNPHDHAEALWKYLSNPELAEKHGRRGRTDLLTHYRWESLVDYFHKVVIPKL
jgi:glycosyltransferase involved in cell wall biosynthesis